MSESHSGGKSGLFSLGVALAAGLVISAAIGARALVQVKSSQQSISIKGYAEKSIQSDMATWGGSFSARAPELPAAYGKLQKDLETVLALLEKKGYAREQVGISAVSTEMLYKTDQRGARTSEVEYYVLTQRVDIATSDVKLAAALATESSGLLAEGVEFRSGAPQYFYTKLEDLKIEMLAAATKDARRRAEEIARSSGCKVGKPRSAGQGVFQITGPYSTNVSDYGAYDTSTIEKTIKGIVSISFGIE